MGATNMKDDSGANGCKDAAHPFGRTTSYFTFAHRMRPTFYNESMGPNGIYVSQDTILSQRTLLSSTTTCLSLLPTSRRSLHSSLKPLDQTESSPSHSLSQLLATSTSSTSLCTVMAVVQRAKSTMPMLIWALRCTCTCKHGWTS